MAFLPCVEVIPEHTERAARIKQSRVKNDVILKAKNQIGREREIEEKRVKLERIYWEYIERSIQIEQFDRGLYIEKDENGKIVVRIQNIEILWKEIQIEILRNRNN